MTPSDVYDVCADGYHTQQEAEKAMIEWRVERGDITSASDPDLSKFKRSTAYKDPVSKGFPLQ